VRFISRIEPLLLGLALCCAGSGVAFAQGAPPFPAFPIDVSGVRLRAAGYLQADAVLLDQSSEDELDPATRAPLNTERLNLKRAHLRLEADQENLGVALEAEGSTARGPTLSLFAAELSYAFGERAKDLPLPLLLASLGLVRIAFGYEVRQHDLERPFLEQGTAIRALFPGSYQLGLRARGAWKFLRYDAGLMSGEPRGASQFAAQAPTHSLDLMGRGGLELELAPGVRFEAGISGLEGRGFHPGTPETKDQLVWRDANGDGIVQLTELQIIPGSSAEPSGTFRRFAVGADAHLTAQLPIGAISLGGELVWALDLDRALYVADPIASGRDQRELGYSASLVWSGLPLSGAVGVRYDRYNPDADATDARAGLPVPLDASVSTLALVISIRVETLVRLMLEYDKNHNAFGRGANGAPASLAADALTLRAEVAF
jgi:hypothetical protein